MRMSMSLISKIAMGTAIFAIFIFSLTLTSVLVDPGIEPTLTMTRMYSRTPRPSATMTLTPTEVYTPTKVCVPLPADIQEQTGSGVGYPERTDQTASNPTIPVIDLSTEVSASSKVDIWIYQCDGIRIVYRLDASLDLTTALPLGEGDLILSTVFPGLETPTP